jgi:hypothetical protein
MLRSASTTWPCRWSPVQHVRVKRCAPVGSRFSNLWCSSEAGASGSPEVEDGVAQRKFKPMGPSNALASAHARAMERTGARQSSPQADAGRVPFLLAEDVVPEHGLLKAHGPRLLARPILAYSRVGVLRRWACRARCGGRLSEGLALLEGLAPHLRAMLLDAAMYVDLDRAAAALAAAAPLAEQPAGANHVGVPGGRKRVVNISVDATGGHDCAPILEGGSHVWQPSK